MSIDEELLARNNSLRQDDNEALVAGNFRSIKRGSDELNDPLGYNFRQAIRQAKNSDNEKSRRQISRESRDNNFRRLTDGILKFAWQNLIPSFGLTIFLIDAHVFLNKVFGPTAFRELGEEWIPASIKKLGDEKTKEMAGLLTVTEKAGCGCLNLGCLMVIIGAAALIFIAGKLITDPIETIWETLFK